jgi:hypothetical protein
VSSKLTNKWEIVTNKSRKSNRTTHNQLPIPVKPITNRYSALRNLQNEQNDLELPRNITSHHNIKKNILLKQNKAISSRIRRKKILLIGDSHMRGCASELGKYLGPEYEVTGIIMPDSRL